MPILANVSWHQLVNGPAIPVMFLVAGTAGAIIVSVLAVQWRRVRVAEADASLKLRMIERGYSAAEIERVLHTSPELVRKKTHRHRGTAKATQNDPCCGWSPSASSS